MRIQTIHRNQMGDVLNECSAQGFQITTADGGRITIMVDGDRLARAEPPSALVGAEDIEVLKRLRAALHDAAMNGWWLGVEVLDRVIAALEAQQPAAVDEARGVVDVYTMQTIADAAAALDKRGDRQMAARLIRLHTRLLAAQHQEPTT